MTALGMPSIGPARALPTCIPELAAFGHDARSGQRGMPAVLRMP